MRGFEQQSDILQIQGDLIPEIDEQLDALLTRGKSQPVPILRGSENPDANRRPPFATTSVEIEFKNEDDLRRCVQLLRWSDDRLRMRPEEQILWDWQQTIRDGWLIKFGVNWYDKAFFEARKDAFKDRNHAGYYKMFGASADSFKMKHHVHGSNAK